MVLYKLLNYDKYKWFSFRCVIFETGDLFHFRELWLSKSSHSITYLEKIWWHVMGGYLVYVLFNLKIYFLNLLKFFIFPNLVLTAFRQMAEQKPGSPGTCNIPIYLRNVRNVGLFFLFVCFILWLCCCFFFPPPKKKC